MLDIQTSALVVVDIQGKLAQIMHEKDSLFKNIITLIKTAKILDIPIIWCQQCPEAIGPTVPEIAQLLNDLEPVNKTAFSCCANEQFNEKMNSIKRKQIILCGIESHICIYQTAMDLKSRNSEVTVVADAVSSRQPESKHIALQTMARQNISIETVEMILFELLKNAQHPKFKEIAAMVK